ncbi:ferrous iron transporter B [Yunchengibacter salinarum]|uniref:ferrous iron transporter B n=1 Tax=Yunchengibacter salinarum TaxID=3133399 RepID=UPI0035B66456
MSTPARIALVGNPNCGKSALFNALTGLRQKVANFPGATVERRTGPMLGEDDLELIDLPGTYSLNAHSPDEKVARDILMGRMEQEKRPDVLIAVVDATNLTQHLRFVLELLELGLPMVLALNMSDLAAREQIRIDAGALSDALGIPVVETVAVRRRGLEELARTVARLNRDRVVPMPIDGITASTLKERQAVARRISKQAHLSIGIGHRTSKILDRIVLNPIIGPVILFALLFIMFQAVYAWAETPMGWIEAGIAQLQTWTHELLPQGFVRSFISSGLLHGVGSVIVFLPQIIILFTFILLLESTGYMARAAFLMDRLMASVGLNGRSFIPLLSSFACAVPGIMAARTISSPRDRLTTILISPLMTCSARLPVYTLIISAFIPNRAVAGGWFNLQGVVMFGLYGAGIISALIIAFIFKRTIAKGASQPFMLELPKYQAPDLRQVAIGLMERIRIFMRRAGTIILASIVVLWVLASFPGPPEGATEPDITYSLVGMIGHALAVVFEPIGFNWEISVALVPGMAAREVAVAALGTVYSMSGTEEQLAQGLVSTLNGAWSLPTALSFLAWFIYAPQCLSTIAITRRETNSWRWPIFMLVYLFALAYLVSFLTYQISSALIG